MQKLISMLFVCVLPLSGHAFSLDDLFKNIPKTGSEKWVTFKEYCGGPVVATVHFKGNPVTDGILCAQLSLTVGQKIVRCKTTGWGEIAITETTASNACYAEMTN